MARYTISHSYVTVLGKLWMPMCDASMCIRLSEYDIEDIRAEDDDGRITRDGIEQWLTSHSGDFSSVTDFCASIEDGEQTLDFPWADDESECAYLDTLPCED